jgi:hypothetical protein
MRWDSPAEVRKLIRFTLPTHVSDFRSTPLPSLPLLSLIPLSSSPSFPTPPTMRDIEDQPTDLWMATHPILFVVSLKRQMDGPILQSTSSAAPFLSNSVNSLPLWCELSRRAKVELTNHWRHYKRQQTRHKTLCPSQYSIPHLTQSMRVVKMDEDVRLQWGHREWDEKKEEMDLGEWRGKKEMSFTWSNWAQTRNPKSRE